MAFTIYAPLKPMLGYRLCKKLKCIDTTVPFWTLLKFQYFVQYIILRILNLAAFCLPVIRPSCSNATAPVFHTTKKSHWIYETVVPMNIYPLHHGVSFYPLLLSFHLPITHRKVRNLRIDVDKFVRKASINFITSSGLHNQHNYQWICCCLCP